MRPLFFFSDSRNAQQVIMKSRRRRWLWLSLSIVVALVIIIVGVFIGYREYRQPPFDRLKQAMNSVASAEEFGAKRHAPELYKEAVNHLDWGRRALEAINRDWWPFGSYRLADSLLGESIRLSEAAVVQSGKNQNTLRIQAEAEVRRYEDSLRVWRRMLDKSLSRTDDEMLYRSVAFKVEGARELADRGLYGEATKSIDVAKSIFGRLEKRYREFQSSSNSRQDTWQAWVDQTIAQSRKTGGAAIIVDKSSHRLYIYVAGKKTASYNCELGYNSGQQKNMAGDGATPEGRYRVVKVNNGSKYYRALLLNYPNDDDRKRFSANLKSGAIPSGAKIGGLIEIHGQGGSGRDWTDGCVAVTNEQMDKIMKVAGVGTPVTIVRHLKHPL